MMTCHRRDHASDLPQEGRSATTDFSPHADRIDGASIDRDRVKYRTPREAAEREVERLRTAIRAALNVLGAIPCPRAAEACPGCEVDIDDARATPRRALNERQPVWEQPPSLPADLTARLDSVRERRARQGRRTKAK